MPVSSHLAAPPPLCVSHQWREMKQCFALTFNAPLECFASGSSAAELRLLHVRTFAVHSAPDNSQYDAVH